MKLILKRKGAREEVQKIYRQVTALLTLTAIPALILEQHVELVSEYNQITLQQSVNKPLKLKIFLILEPKSVPE